MTLRMDDVDPGMWITILQGPQRAQYTHADDGPSHHGNEGLPMKVLVVDMPFLILEMPAGERKIMDTRKYLLKKLSLEYVEAILKEIRKQ